MKIFRFTRHIVLSLLFILMASATFSQIKVKTRIDSSDILIGDPIVYSLKAVFNNDIEVTWPVFHDTIGSFGIISVSDVDSGTEDGKKYLSQEITFTHFDSGQQVVPPLAIAFRKKNDTAFKYIFTDTFQVHVHTLPVDTSKAIRPIKAIMNAPVSFRELLPYLLILTAILIGIFLYIYLKRKKANRPFPWIKQKPKLPPHVVAFSELRKLEDEKLWQKGDIKPFHIRLTDIIRIYIEDRFEVPAVESTTPEILSFLNDLIENRELVASMKSLLELSDLVKFAKSSPLPDENEFCLKTAYHFIDSTKAGLFEDGEEKERKNETFSDN